MTTLIERLQTEADLCRNEGADDIARLLDEAVAELTAAPRARKSPLYDQAALDAAVAAERERCAKACEDEANRWRDRQDIRDFQLCAARIRSGA